MPPINPSLPGAPAQRLPVMPVMPNEATVPLAERPEQANTVQPGAAQAIDEVEHDYAGWRTDKQIHELQWFVSTAMVRGAQDMKHEGYVTDADGQLQVEASSKKRLRVRFNRLLQKYKARQSKFLKTRFTPEVRAFGNDRDDILNARATQRAFEHFHIREQVERKYRLILNHANTTGKGFAWLFWDKTKQAQVQVPTVGGAQKVYDVTLGDIALEAGSPFEVLVPDPGKSSLHEQEKIMRVKVRLVSDVKVMYGQAADGIKGEFTGIELFQYQRQIAGLSSKGTMGAMNPPNDGLNAPEYVVLKELFCRPNGDYPKGRHLVVGGGKLLLMENELPYGLWDQSNPFPVVEFPDLDMPGQFWPPTLVEQLIDVQKAHNLAWAKVLEHLRYAVHPKVMAPVQAQWPKKAWHGGPGEVVRFLAFPGMPGPQVVQPPNISGDVWRILNLLDQEFDKVTSLFPASMGQAGNEESGFQVNLLQEAADSVHAADIRLHELAFEELYYKVRRMMKWGYSVPRLLNILGRNYQEELTEFSTENIDEHATIRVYTGSALSSSPAIRTKQVQELFKTGLFGPPGDPAVARRGLKLIDAEGIGEFKEESRKDEELAYRRLRLLRGGEAFGSQNMVPMPWEDHEVHWEVMTNVFKEPEFDDWAPEAKLEAFKVVVWHMRWKNPSQAFNLANELGLTDLIPLLADLAMQAGAPPAQPGAPQPGGAGNAPAPPPPTGAPPPA
jgi:hypothetical protein